MKIAGGSFIILLFSVLCSRGAESQHYRIEQQGATAATGGIAGGGSYQNVGTAGDTGGISGAGIYLAKGGFTGQIYHDVALSISSPGYIVTEGSVHQLGAWLVCDDASTLPLPASSVQWQAASGPVSIDAGGMLSTGPVYNDRFVIVAAYQGDRRSAIHLIVKNGGSDDFGLYAADGIDDRWQVDHFGENNPDGASDRDPFGSGHSNLFKYMAGLDPLDPMSRFIVRTAYDPIQGRMQLNMAPCFETRNYHIMVSEDLKTWQPVTLEPLAAERNEKAFVDFQPKLRKRYYRVEITIRE